MKIDFETINNIEEIDKITAIIYEILVLEYCEIGKNYHSNYINKDFLQKHKYIAFPIGEIKDDITDSLFLKLNYSDFYIIGFSNKNLKPISKENFIKPFPNKFFVHFRDDYVCKVKSKTFNLSKAMFWTPTSFFLFSSLDFKVNFVYCHEWNYGIIFFKNSLLKKMNKNILYDLQKDYIEFINSIDDLNIEWRDFHINLKNYYESILKEQGYLPKGDK